MKLQQEHWKEAADRSRDSPRRRETDEQGGKDRKERWLSVGLEIRRTHTQGSALSTRIGV